MVKTHRYFEAKTGKSEYTEKSNITFLNFDFLTYKHWVDINFTLQAQSIYWKKVKKNIVEQWKFIVVKANRHREELEHMKLLVAGEILIVRFHERINELRINDLFLCSITFGLTS